MKIKISKSQWLEMGKTARWMSKEALGAPISRKPLPQNAQVQKSDAEIQEVVNKSLQAKDPSLAYKLTTGWPTAAIQKVQEMINKGGQQTQPLSNGQSDGQVPMPQQQPMQQAAKSNSKIK